MIIEINIQIKLIEYNQSEMYMLSLLKILLKKNIIYF
jgi:hypothetical protein